MAKAIFKQIDVTRAIKGALAADVLIAEVNVTKDGVRVIFGDPRVRVVAAAPNEWDEVYARGPQE